jgi:hypothetical protein
MDDTAMKMELRVLIQGSPERGGEKGEFAPENSRCVTYRYFPRKISIYS